MALQQYKIFASVFHKNIYMVLGEADGYLTSRNGGFCHQMSSLLAEVF